jgi:hypothetical protein
MALSSASLSSMSLWKDVLLDVSEFRTDISIGAMTGDISGTGRVLVPGSKGKAPGMESIVLFSDER